MSVILKLRRWVLKQFIPEWFWPKEIVLDDTPILIRHQPYSFGTKWILRKCTYEEAERIILKEILHPGMQVLEMGSSIGVLTAIVANKIGSTGKMVAVEASESLVNHSKTWLSKYPQLQVLSGYAFPVWKAPSLQINSFNEDKGSLGGVLSFDYGPVSGNNKPVNIWDIERICREYSLRPELLLVDIEGSETIMLETVLGLPDSIQYIIMEFHPGLYPDGVETQNIITKKLLDEGFAISKSVFNVCLLEKQAQSKR